MEKIFILGNSKLVEQLGENFKEIPNFTNDYDIHNWVVSLFQANEIEKVVIEIGDNKLLSLKIGYHIRFSLNELKKSAFIPVLFLSTATLNAIVTETGIWSHIFATKGVYFSGLSNIDNISNIQLELSVIEGVSQNEYKTQFLDIVKILPDETIGRHSLANIWGAYSMDRAANVNVLDSTEFQKEKTKLYFKYISAFNEIKTFSPLKTVGFINLDPPRVINATHKKILLIDDEADKGWDSVLRKVFKTSTCEDFVIISEKVKDYDSFSPESKRIIENTAFDLYLIDLRLNGIEEENTLQSNEFSGMKVMQKIKSLNQGNQVIIFTASNKVWNLKALLDAGADGYYMKESPEYAFSNKFSEQNYKGFQKDVKNCFERDYLKKVFISKQKITSDISKANTISEEQKSELQKQLQLFWNLLLIAQSKTQFANAFVSLYMLIEQINGYFIKKINDDKWEIVHVGNLLDWRWEKSTNTYTNSGSDVVEKKPSESQKFAGLYFQKWLQTDNSFVRNVSFLITKRNGFIHNDKRILDKQDITGQYLNHDIYTEDGILKLIGVVEIIIGFL